MKELRMLRKRKALTQAELADAAGTSQPAIAAYESGRRSPTLATIQRLARSVGLEARVEFHPPLTREDRRSLALHEAIAARLENDPDAVLGKARSNLERMAARHPGAGQLLQEWQVLLGRAVEELVPVLTDPSPRSRELRQVTPFAGVLSAGERARVYREFAQREERRR